jgi:hypothetical protein
LKDEVSRLLDGGADVDMKMKVIDSVQEEFIYIKYNPEYFCSLTDDARMDPHR